MSTLAELKKQLSEVNAAIHARFSGSGGAVVEMRIGDRQTRWAQSSYDEMIRYRDDLERRIEAEESALAGRPRRRPVRMF